MKIDLSNYEAYLLDLAEGKLSQAEETELFNFLKAHSLTPDIFVPEDLDQLRLKAEFEETFPNTKSLVQPNFLDQNVLRKWFLDDVAGRLTDFQRQQLHQWIENHSIDHLDDTLFSGIKVDYDPSVHYDSLDQLKRTTIIHFPVRYIAVAALLILALLLFLPGKQEFNSYTQLEEKVDHSSTSDDKTPATDSQIRSNHLKTVSTEVVENTGKQTIKTEGKTSDDPTYTKAKNKGETGDNFTSRQKPSGSKPREDKKSGTNKPLKERDNPAYPKSTQKGNKGGREADLSPTPITPRTIIISNSQAGVAFALATPRKNTINSRMNREGLLAQVLQKQLASIRKDGDRDFLSSDALSRSGLNLLAKLSGKRLTAKTTEDGTVTSVAYSSKLLTVNFPVNRQ